jgi:hypothetical protein
VVVLFVVIVGVAVVVVIVVVVAVAGGAEVEAVGRADRPELTLYSIFLRAPRTAQRKMKLLTEGHLGRACSGRFQVAFWVPQETANEAQVVGFFAQVRTQP